jgi:hypothetical protein
MGEKGIGIPCVVEGHEGEQVIFKRAGWKYKHLRIWEQAVKENALKVVELAEFIGERIESWTLTDEDGQAVKFLPGPEVLDELPNRVSTWVIAAFRDAYWRSQVADPNA